MTTSLEWPTVCGWVDECVRVSYWACPMRKILWLFLLKVWQSQEKWMPDTQTCTDICGQMHGAGATAGRSPHMCWRGKITNSGHPSAALGDLFLICCTLFLQGHMSTLAKCDSELRCTTAACTCRPHPPQIRPSPVKDTLTVSPRGIGICMVVKRLISRLSSAQGQSCTSLTVPALIAHWFVCYGSS